jgi:mRNA interferase RelE/StbE
MAGYRLVFRRSVAKDLRQIPKADVARILACVRTLEETPRPHGSERLSGQERYRIRQGNWRILYEISENERVVTVVRVGHRREVYRR